MNTTQSHETATTQEIPVIIVVYDAVVLLDFAGPLQAFITANNRHAEQSPILDGAPKYRVTLASSTGGLVRTGTGVEVMSELLPASLEPGTTILVPGGTVEAMKKDQVLKRWLLAQAPKAERLCSVCTGAFILADLGLLDGKDATTHWAYCDDFSKRYPAVHVKPDALFTKNGPIWTSAGISAGVDLALALIEEDRGSALATATARWLVVGTKRSGAQSQFSDVIELASRDTDNIFYDLHAWINANLTKDLSLSVMANRMQMSERTFFRKYKDAIGVSPAYAVRLLRAEKAKSLLASTNASLKSVARQAGFTSVERMNKTLENIYGIRAKAIK